MFKLFVALNLCFSQVAFAQAQAEGGDGGQCERAAEEGKTQCADSRILGGQLAKEKCRACRMSPGIQAKAGCLTECTAGGASNMWTAAGVCAKGIDTCMNGCRPSGDTRKCDDLRIMLEDAKKEMSEYASLSAQSFETVKSTGGQPLPSGDGLTWGDAAKGLAIAGALGAVTYGVISATSNSGSKQQQQQSSTSNQPTLGPLPTDTETDPTVIAGCGTKADAPRYSACNDYYSKNCAQTATDAACQAFFVRYCGTGQAAIGTEIDKLTVDKTGEGMGQPICKNIVAKQYCAVAGRDACPSCQNVNSQGSPSCTNQSQAANPNPNLCVPQLDQAQKDAAKLTCGTDPLFMNPSFTQVATGTTSGLPQIVIASAGGQWRDVASENSPSVFNLSSTTMQSLCAKGKLNCP